MTNFQKFSFPIFVFTTFCYFSAGALSIRTNASHTDYLLIGQAYKRGVKDGALAVMNYDRKSKGLEPYKTWDEMEEDIKSTKQALEYWQELINERKQRNLEANKYPPKPWVKHGN